MAVGAERTEPKMLKRYVRFVVHRPKSVILLVALVTVTLASFIGRLRVLLDVDDQIPPDHPLVVVGKRIEKHFGGKFVTIVGIYPREGTIYSTSVLGKVQRITDALEKVPGIKPGSVVSLMSERVKDIKSTEEDLEIRPLAEKVPETPEELEAFKERVKRNEVMTSLLVSPDGKATAIIADFQDFERAGGAAGFYDRLESILDPERDAEVEILSAGSPSILYWLLVYTRRVAALFVLALAMIGLLLYRAFRTVQGMLVPLVTAIMGVVWALGVMGLIRAPMDPWNIMTPILLLAIGAGHSVQILKRYYEEYARLQVTQPELSPVERNREAVVEATSKVGLVMLAAGTIASLSFGSLVVFGLQSIRNFGLCASFGILATLIVEMTFIPAVRALLPPPTPRQTDREKRREYFDPILERLAALVRQKKEGPILWACLGAVLVASFGAVRLEVGNSLGAQFFESNAPVRGFRMADSHMAGTRVVQVLVEGQAPDAIKNPEVLARMDELGRFILKQPLPVGKVVSLVDVLRQMQRMILNEDPASGTLPDTPEAVAQYLLLYSMSGDSDDLSRLVDQDFQRAVLTIYLKTDDFRVMKALTVATQAEADRLFQGLPVRATVGGGVTNAIALNETMVSGKVKNVLQISALVVVITALFLRSIVGGLFVFLPLATAVLVNLGFMGWTGIWLSMGTAAISAMAVGIGADYAIYLLFRVREEFWRLGDLREAIATALTTSGKAIAYVATAVGGGYLCLALSLFKVHVLLGVLVALTMVTASAATVALLPALLLRLEPRFLARKEAR